MTKEGVFLLPDRSAFAFGFPLPFSPKCRQKIWMIRRFWGSVRSRKKKENKCHAWRKLFWISVPSILEKSLHSLKHCDVSERDLSTSWEPSELNMNYSNKLTAILCKVKQSVYQSKSLIFQIFAFNWRYMIWRRSDKISTILLFSTTIENQSWAHFRHLRIHRGPKGLPADASNISLHFPAVVSSYCPFLQLFLSMMRFHLRSR